jgi:osmoprotectant transport system permease protein
MDLLAGVVAWFLDAENWAGTDGVPNRVAEHLQVSGAAVLVAAAVALPLGLYIGHTNRLSLLTVSLANIGRAVPSYALLAIFFALVIPLSRDIGTFTFVPTFLAMTLLAIPPIVTNTYIGMREVDPDLVEAARGMGMHGGQVLARLEIPLAMPVVLAGVRTAAVQVIATATLGAVIGGGGLGRYIVQGIARSDEPRLVAGALLVALMAIAAELAFGLVGRATASPGLSDRARLAATAREPSQVPLRPEAT